MFCWQVGNVRWLDSQILQIHNILEFRDFPVLVFREFVGTAAPVPLPSVRLSKILNEVKSVAELWLRFWKNWRSIYPKRSIVKAPEGCEKLITLGNHIQNVCIRTALYVNEIAIPISSIRPYILVILPLPQNKGTLDYKLLGIPITIWMFCLHIISRVLCFRGGDVLFCLTECLGSLLLRLRKPGAYFLHRAAQIYVIIRTPTCCDNA